VRKFLEKELVYHADLCPHDWDAEVLGPACAGPDWISWLPRVQLGPRQSNTSASTQASLDLLFPCWLTVDIDLLSQGRETVPSWYGPAQFSSAKPSHPLADGSIFANQLGTPSVQSHCLATFNPFMLIGVCVSNSSLDTTSECPVWMSGQIVLTCTPRFYCALSFWSLLWVRNWARPIGLLGMLSTQGDLTELDHQQPMTQPRWELNLANQLVRYAVHPKGPHGTQSPTAHDTAPFGLPRAHRVFIAPDPWAVFFRPLALIRELSGSPTAKPWVQPSGNCSRGNWTLHLSAWCTTLPLEHAVAIEPLHPFSHLIPPWGSLKKRHRFPSLHVFRFSAVFSGCLQGGFRIEKKDLGSIFWLDDNVCGE